MTWCAVGPVGGRMLLLLDKRCAPSVTVSSSFNDLEIGKLWPETLIDDTVLVRHDLWAAYSTITSDLLGFRPIASPLLRNHWDSPIRPGRWRRGRLRYVKTARFHVIMHCTYVRHLGVYITIKRKRLLVMIRYIENIDISFSISIYRIVSSKKISNFSIHRNIFYISWYFRYIMIFLRQKFIFLLLHYQNNENKQRKWQTSWSKLTALRCCLLYTSPSPRD